MNESMHERFGVGRKKPVLERLSFSLVPVGGSRPLMLDLRTRGGDATGIAYSYLQTVRHIPSVGLTLSFTTHLVTLHGRNLGELYLSLLAQAVRSIVEQGEHDREPEEALVVSRIRVEEL